MTTQSTHKSHAEPKKHKSYYGCTYHTALVRAERRRHRGHHGRWLDRCPHAA